ncbi:lamin tail domain-containing protein [Patescibacteria group bacterium]
MRKLRYRLGALVALLALVFPLAAPAATCPDIAEGASCCVCFVCDCGCTADQDDGAPDNQDDSSGAPTADYATFDVRLNELLPNPVGSDAEGEFVELYNMEGAAASLDGWTLTDGSGRSQELDGLSLVGGGRLALGRDEAGIPLVNGGGRLALVDPDGTERDFVEYGESAEGQAFARFADGWDWTDTPTPGTENVPTAADDGDQDDTTGDEPGGNDEPDDGDGTSDVTEPDDTGDGTEPTPDYAAFPVMLSELLPNPEGNDAEGEWIEIHNAGGTPLDLSGWLLDDLDGGGSSAHELPAGTVIPADGYLTVARSDSGLSLNNDSDSARLVAPDGTLLDTVSYESVPEGESFARFGHTWRWTATPTPGAENELPPEPTDEPTDDGGADADPSTETVSVEQAHDVPDGTEVTVSALVTMPFGIAGKTIFGIRDTDTDYGATVRVYGDTLPGLAEGDLVTVTGTVTRKSSGELRINSSNAKISIGESVGDVPAADMPLDGLAAQATGLTVYVEGLVADSGRGWFTLTDESGTFDVLVELPEGEQPDYEPGQLVRVRGVVRSQSASLALAVLDGADVSQIEVTLAEEGGDAEGPAAGTLPFLVVGALGAGGMAYRGLRHKPGKTGN